MDTSSHAPHEARAGGAGLTRRAAFTGLAGIGAGNALPAFAASDPVSPTLSYPFGQKLDVEYLKLSPEEVLDARLRIAYTTEHLGYAYEYANLIYFLNRPGLRPLPFIGREAMVITRYMRMDRGAYQQQINEFSRPISLETGEYIREITHPVTGRPLELPTFKMNDLEPGFMISADGDWPLSRPALTPKQIAQRPTPNEPGQQNGLDRLDKPQIGGRATIQKRTLSRLRRENDLLFFDQVKVPPNSSFFPVDFAEHFTHQCRVADYNDKSIKCVPSIASGTWKLPLSDHWLPGFTGVDGYFVVHVEKRKLRSPDDCPDRFLSTVKRIAPYIFEIEESRFRTGPSIFNDD